MIKTGIVATNKKAGFLYKLEDEYEAGIVLNGDEVKSLRMGRCDLKDAYVEIKDGQAFLIEANIPQYVMSSMASPTRRKRKLLLHKFQIRRIAARLLQGGYTCVPISLVFNEHGYAKVKISIAHGKKNFEHKDRIIEREQDRELGRVLKNKEL